MCDCNNNCGCGSLTIPTGPAGTGIERTEIVGGNLIIFYDDGTNEVVGNVLGASGTDGADGVDGNTWLHGQGAPSGSDGADGDYYLDTATGDVYNNSGGTWTLITNITGPEGPEGPAGETLPGGGTGLISYDVGTTYTLASPNVIHDVGWTAGSVTVASSTDSSRVSIGDMQIITGNLTFTGIYSGSGSPDILIELGGPLMNSGNNNTVVQLLAVSGKYVSCVSYVSPVGSTNYLRIVPDTSELLTVSSTYTMTYHLLLVYDV